MPVRPHDDPRPVPRSVADAASTAPLPGSVTALAPRPRDPGRRPGPVIWLNVLAVTLIVAGVTFAVAGRNTLRWSPPPRPPAWAARPPARLAHGATAARLRRSAPVSIKIPAIRVRARVFARGLTTTGAIEVPPLTRPFETVWYDRGPAPGQHGAAVIVGHVDAAGVGPAVFYELGDLRPGDKIYVRLRSGSTAVFEAYSVALFRKTRFPTAAVYGYTGWPTLRLVTCGGQFDPRTGHYLGNTVVFASYVGENRSG